MGYLIGVVNLVLAFFLSLNARIFVIQGLSGPSAIIQTHVDSQFVVLAWNSFGNTELGKRRNACELLLLGRNHSPRVETWERESSVFLATHP